MHIYMYILYIYIYMFIYAIDQRRHGIHGSSILFLGDSMWQQFCKKCTKDTADSYAQNARPCTG